MKRILSTDKCSTTERQIVMNTEDQSKFNFIHAFAGLLVVLALLALVSSATAKHRPKVHIATSGGAAYADAQHWAQVRCAGLGGWGGYCKRVFGSYIYLTHPGAGAGQVQWDTYTVVQVGNVFSVLPLCHTYNIYAGFGPFSDSGQAVPVKWTSFDSGGC